MFNPFIHNITISAAVVSDAGKIRGNNEDNYYLNGKYCDDNSLNCSRENLSGISGSSLFAVCDGMGGEEHGEIASLVAVRNLNAIKGYMHKKEIKECLLDINRKIDMNRRELGCRNMGSTIAALYSNGSKAFACNVGDSRVYMYRNGKLKQLSQDHNATSNLVNVGIMSKDEAKKDPGYHVLVQYLGVPEDEFIIEPFFSKEIKLKNKDVYLICSDGVTDVLSEDMILGLLHQEESIQIVAQNIVNASIENGSKDNITALVIRIESCLYRGTLG